MAQSTSTSRLFSPMNVGSTSLAHRIIMAPLTRLRASDITHVPILPMVQEYYSQRACVPGTLLISEATAITQRAGGMRNIPGIWSAEQIEAWKTVVAGVHARGSKIFLQMWAIGRAATEEVAKEEGWEVVSSSAVPIDDTPQYALPRALTEEEIYAFIDDYAQAAKNAVEGAGFDGVEIHGANGYLIDQFTKDTCNQRTDQWGGSIENRNRFAYEVTKKVVEAVGAEKTAIRLSPFSDFQGMAMKDPVPQFTDLITRLRDFKLAYLHLMWRSHRDPTLKTEDQMRFVIDAWKEHSPVFICGWQTPESARKLVDESFKGKDIGVVFGRSFMSNPDLVFRIQNGLELKESDSKDWYRPKNPQGYIDEPFSKEWLAQHPQSVSA